MVPKGLWRSYIHPMVSLCALPRVEPLPRAMPIRISAGFDIDGFVFFTGGPFSGRSFTKKTANPSTGVANKFVLFQKITEFHPISQNCANDRIESVFEAVYFQILSNGSSL